MLLNKFRIIRILRNRLIRNKARLIRIRQINLMKTMKKRLPSTRLKPYCSCYYATSIGLGSRHAVSNSTLTMQTIAITWCRLLNFIKMWTLKPITLLCALPSFGHTKDGALSSLNSLLTMRIWTVVIPNTIETGLLWGTREPRLTTSNSKKYL